MTLSVFFPKGLLDKIQKLKFKFIIVLQEDDFHTMTMLGLLPYGAKTEFARNGHEVDIFKDFGYLGSEFGEYNPTVMGSDRKWSFVGGRRKTRTAMPFKGDSHPATNLTEPTTSTSKIPLPNKLSKICYGKQNQ